MRSIISCYLFIASVALGSPLRIIAPQNSTVCIEGGSCPVCWSTQFRGAICIEGALGGHSIGILNDCATPAKAGYFDWHVPVGQVTGFGISEETCARFMIYPKDDPSQAVMSPCFTIKGQKKPHELRRIDATLK